jgi:hypothetical protein
VVVLQLNCTGLRLVSSLKCRFTDSAPVELLHIATRWRLYALEMLHQRCTPRLLAAFFMFNGLSLISKVAYQFGRCRCGFYNAAHIA